MAASPHLQTEHDFTLPYGYVDDRGTLRRHGQMRLATALDEVEPLADPRVHTNRAYISILLLSRVITRLDDLSPVAPEVVERLFAADFAYLQDLYIRLNDLGDGLAETECPHCGRRFAVDVASGT